METKNANFDPFSKHFLKQNKMSFVIFLHTRQIKNQSYSEKLNFFLILTRFHHRFFLALVFTICRLHVYYSIRDTSEILMGDFWYKAVIQGQGILHWVLLGDQIRSRWLNPWQFWSPSTVLDYLIIFKGWILITAYKKSLIKCTGL